MTNEADTQKSEPKMKVIKTGDTPAFDRMFEEQGFKRGRIFRTDLAHIPVEVTLYNPVHGKGRNAYLLLSIGHYHFCFRQVNFVDFDGDAEETLDQNPELTLRD